MRERLGDSDLRWFGARVRDARERSGLRQKDLPGASPSVISRIEHGQYQPSLALVRLISQSLSAPELLEEFNELLTADRSKEANADPFLAKTYRLLAWEVLIRLPGSGGEVIVQERRHLQALTETLTWDHVCGIPLIDDTRADVAASAIDGCQITHTNWESEDYAIWTVEFPEALRPGESRWFSIEKRLSKMYPAYAPLPYAPVDRLNIRLIVPDPDDYVVRGVDGIPIFLNQDLNYVMEQGRKVSIDKFGMAEYEATNLREGRVYGIHWFPAS